MSAGDDEAEPGTRADERQFSVVPGEPEDGKRWPEEPDPPDLGPDVPEVEAPNPSQASPELRRIFWTLVVVLDVAILCVAVGLMFIGFEGRWRFGGQLVLAGCVLFVYAAYRYYRYRRGADETDDQNG